MSSMSKFVAALVGMLVMLIVTSRQLFLFAGVQRSSGLLDSLAGRFHLWLAIGASVAACIAGSLMFRFFSRHEKNKWSKVPMTPAGPLLTPIVHKPFTNLPAPIRFDAIRWARANPWLTEGQADDRIPMIGSVTDSNGTPSEQRAFARRFHQLMFKKWSQARHD